MRLKALPWDWAIIASLVAVDVAWLGFAHLALPWKSAAVWLAIVAMLLALTALYSYVRPDERLAVMTGSAAKLFIYSASGGLFSYLVATLRRPLIDSDLYAADHAVGFDWPAMYAFVESHDVLRVMLTLAYYSVIPQIGILVIVLASWKRYDRMHSFVWLYIISGLAYILISGFMPAMGAFGYYKAALSTPYVQHFQALREGSAQTSDLFRTLDLFKLQGIVQFPSFHLTLAVLCTYAAWGMRFLFPAFLALNIFVVAATPAIGGHFFVDLWVSALLTGALIVVAERRLKAARPISRTEEARAAADEADMVPGVFVPDVE